MRFFTYVAMVMANDDGAPSSNRWFALAILSCLLFWACRIVVETNNIPPIPETWLYLIGTFVGAATVKKGIDGYKAVKGAIDGGLEKPAQ